MSATPGTFRDLFSKQAADYARFRPTYPRALFDFLAGAAPGRELAWDAGGADLRDRYSARELTHCTN